MIFLETNYDDDMLENGSYPVYLKRRIRSAYGHMSNTDSAALIRDYASPHLSHLILGHLSENNNHPTLVQKEIQSILAERNDLKPRVLIASRYSVGKLVQIDA